MFAAYDWLSFNYWLLALPAEGPVYWLTRGRLGRRCRQRRLDAATGGLIWHRTVFPPPTADLRRQALDWWRMALVALVGLVVTAGVVWTLPGRRRGVLVESGKYENRACSFSHGNDGGHRLLGVRAGQSFRRPGPGFKPGPAITGIPRQLFIGRQENWPSLLGPPDVNISEDFEDAIEKFHQGHTEKAMSLKTSWHVIHMGDGSERRITAHVRIYAQDKPLWPAESVTATGIIDLRTCAAKVLYLE